MVEATVYATYGKVHEISSKKDGRIIVIGIDTPCKHLKKISHLEIPLDVDLMINDNPVIDQANKASCCYSCIVPSAILNVCGVEKEYWDESEVKETKVGIVFN
jgi:hypothetical protein